KRRHNSCSRSPICVHMTTGIAERMRSLRQRRRISKPLSYPRDRSRRIRAGLSRFLLANSDSVRKATYLSNHLPDESGIAGSAASPLKSEFPYMEALHDDP